MKPISFRGFPLNADGLTSQFQKWFARPALRPVMVRRQGNAPLITAVELEAWQLPPLEMMIDDEAADADFDALRLGILRAFDTREAAGALIVADDDGSNERYVMAVCQEPTQVSGQGGDVFVATLVAAAGEQFWQSVEPAEETTTLTASGQTLAVTNDGEVDAYPVIEIEPVSARTGTGHWLYRRFVVVRWRTPSAASYYPTQISGDNAAWDTTALTPGKAIDDTSVGVLVDGVEVDRWFSEEVDDNDQSFDQVDTRLWVNLDFRAALSVTLTAAIDDTEGAVEDGLTVDEDISAFPPAGILYAPAANELFYYLSRDVRQRTFHGVTRAAYGSTAATHSAGATLEWIQHEVFIVYSPEEDIARVADESYAPFIELPSSDNAGWDWAYLDGTGERGWSSEDEVNRSGRWQPVTAGDGTIYTAQQHGTDVDPFDTLGIVNTTAGNENLARWQAYFPAGINSFTADGQTNADTAVEAVKFYTSVDGANWTRVGEFPATGSDDWDGFSVALLNETAGWRYLRFELLGELGEAEIYQAGVSFESDLKPVARLMPEVANYALDMRITNTTTGEWIELTAPAGLATGDVVTVDTEAKTVVADPFGRNIYRAMTKGSHRAAVLRLQPGANTIQVDETGLDEVAITVTWRERMYT